MPYFFRGIRSRYTLIAGLFICLFALFCSSLFIWQIQVTGNVNVPAAVILRELEDIGIGIGTYWPSMVSDSVRSEILLKIPELSWITVNVTGSSAEVKVRERTFKPEIVNEALAADVVARKAGIITRVGTLMGMPSVKAGDTVLPWDVLISSEVTSLFTEARYVHAMGEVRARTWLEITSAAPVRRSLKVDAGEMKTKFALILGRRRINLYFGTGINTGSCDKMVEIVNLKFGNGFALPIALVKETFVYYNTEVSQGDIEAEYIRLEDNLYDRLFELIGAEGSIVSSHFTRYEGRGLLYVTLRAECIEEIGVQRILED
jgi:similar to stage IV sporulation protein